MHVQCEIKSIYQQKPASLIWNSFVRRSHCLNLASVGVLNWISILGKCDENETMRIAMQSCEGVGRLGSGDEGRMRQFFWVISCSFEDTIHKLTRKIINFKKFKQIRSAINLSRKQQQQNRQLQIVSLPPLKTPIKAKIVSNFPN